LFKTHSIGELGEMLGITRQAVSYRLRKYPEYNAIKELKARKRRDFIGGVVRMYSDGMSPSDVAEFTGLSTSRVYAILSRYATDYPRLKPVGCDKCKTEPYALGLCNACYQRNRRRNS
jgi:DNA-binding transcriptional regulator GbsR (MarR family)